MTDTAKNAVLEEIETIKEEILHREADYLEMDSEKARKADIRSTYIRYMRQARGNNPIWTAIAAGLALIFMVVLGYAVMGTVNGTMDPSLWVVVGVLCGVCVFGVVAIAARDFFKRTREAKIGLSSHIHRYEMAVRQRKIDLDELKAKLAELETGK